MATTVQWARETLENIPAGFLQALKCCSPFLYRTDTGFWLHTCSKETATFIHVMATKSVN